ECAFQAGFVAQQALHAIRIRSIASELLELCLLWVGFVQSVLDLRQSLDFLLYRLHYQIATALWRRKIRVLLPVLLRRRGGATLSVIHVIERIRIVFRGADITFQVDLPTVEFLK